MIIVVLTSGGCSSDIFMILKLILFSDAKLCWIKMGKLLSKIFGSKEMRILMLGLDAAGKTSILSLVMKTTTTVLVDLWSMFYLESYTTVWWEKSKYFQQNVKYLVCTCTCIQNVQLILLDCQVCVSYYTRKDNLNWTQ